MIPPCIGYYFIREHMSIDISGSEIVLNKRNVPNYDYFKRSQDKNYWLELHLVV